MPNRLRIFVVAIVTVFSPPSCKLDASPPSAPSYVFQIPAFPGTEAYMEYIPDLKVFAPPFTTDLTVYRTKDGKAVDLEAVISYYQMALESKGWRKGIFERQEKAPFLAMTTQVYEDLKDGTHIQAAGDLYLWVAPQDGMITVYLHQWRNSQADQATKQALEAGAETLRQAAGSLHYEIRAAERFGNWVESYQNEYLIAGRGFGLISETNPPNNRHADEDKFLGATLTTYRDAGIAETERKRSEKLPRGLGSYNRAVTKGKLLILVEDASGKQAKAVDQILEAFASPKK